MCFQASTTISDTTGWRVAIGTFDPDPFNDAADRIYGHAWNVMSDGRIYDATSSQFGLPEPYITVPENPCYSLDAILP